MSLKPAWTMEKPYLKERKKKLVKKERVVKYFHRHTQKGKTQATAGMSARCFIVPSCVG